MQTAIVVHGGAGSWKENRLEEALAACQQAAEAGQRVLVRGGPALDAVEVAVQVLEDCPATDAGVGSHLNREGRVEMDALIMEGRDLRLGAVAAVQRVRHPISLARRVMEDSPHTFLVAYGAETFAEQIRFPRCDAEELLVGDELADYQEMLAGSELATGGNTVGAVALDRQGNLVCGTSTGGTRMKLPGRVGDSPLVGSGGYADNETAAVSATGHGESLMKVLISRRVCDFVAQGLPAQAACNAAMMILEDRVDGRGGVIAVDFVGRVGVAFNTAAMPFAHAIGAAPIVSGR